MEHLNTQQNSAAQNSGSQNCGAQNSGAQNCGAQNCATCVSRAALDMVLGRKEGSDVCGLAEVIDDTKL